MSFPGTTPSPRLASTVGLAVTGSCCRGSSATHQILIAVESVPDPTISRWKMLDNLRRTLSAPAAF